MRKVFLLFAFVMATMLSVASTYKNARDVINGNSRWSFINNTGNDSWKKHYSETDKPKGSGTEKDPYKITSAAELAYFLFNNNKNDEYWELTKDIDMSAYYWPGTGTTFRGHFDGHNHTIKGMCNKPDTGSGNEGSGLFDRVDMYAQIHNLHIYKCFFKGDGRVGGVIGCMYETSRYAVLQNVHVDEVLLVSSGNNVGGLVGRIHNVNTRPEIANCSFNGEIYLIGSKSSAAGLVGYAYKSKLSLIDCIVEKGIDSAPNNDGINDWTHVGNLVGHWKYETAPY